MFENIKLIETHYPDWYVYIYWHDLKDDVVDKLGKAWDHVVLRESKFTGPMAMFDRFMPIDDSDVDIMIVRDADSRIHERDQWAINQFIADPNKKFHIIRDHAWHNCQILGGLWGIKKGCLQFSITNRIMEYSKIALNVKSVDQTFLRLYIYPNIKGNALIHSSLKSYTLPGETTTSFKNPVTNDDFCGQICQYTSDGKFVNQHKYVN